MGKCYRWPLSDENVLSMAFFSWETCYRLVFSIKFLSTTFYYTLNVIDYCFIRKMQKFCFRKISISWFCTNNVLDNFFHSKMLSIFFQWGTTTSIWNGMGRWFRWFCHYIIVIFQCENSSVPGPARIYYFCHFLRYHQRKNRLSW